MAVSIVTDLKPFRLAASPAFVKILTDKAGQPNIRIDVSPFHKHWGEGSTLIGTDSKTPDASGHAIFELSDYFKSFIKPSFTFPAVDTAVIHPDAAMGFFILVNEYYGNPPAPTSYVTSDYYLSAPGLIPPWMNHLFFGVYENYNDKITKGDTRLSFEHLFAVASKKAFERVISKQDILKLFIHAADDFNALKLVFNLVFTDKTVGTYTWQQPQQLPEVLKGQLIEFEVGYDHHQLDSFIEVNYPGKILSRYTVQVLNHPDTLLCPDHTYVLNHIIPPYRREFIFRNSLGAYDTLVTTGEATAEIKYTYELAKVPYWPQNVNPAVTRNLFTETDPVIQCHTGFITKDRLAWLPEFFSSPEAYEIIGSRLIPIVFKPQSIMYHRDKPGVYFASFEYQQVETVEAHG